MALIITTYLNFSTWLLISASFHDVSRGFLINIPSVIYCGYIALIITSYFYLSFSPTYVMIFRVIFTTNCVYLLSHSYVIVAHSLDYSFSLLSCLPPHCKALNSLTCADVPLRNYSLTHPAVMQVFLCCEFCDERLAVLKSN